MRKWLVFAPGKMSHSMVIKTYMRPKSASPSSSASLYASNSEVLGQAMSCCQLFLLKDIWSLHHNYWDWLCIACQSGITMLQISSKTSQQYLQLARNFSPTCSMFKSAAWGISWIPHTCNILKKLCNEQQTYMYVLNSKRCNLRNTLSWRKILVGSQCWSSHGKNGLALKLDRSWLGLSSKAGQVMDHDLTSGQVMDHE